MEIYEEIRDELQEKIADIEEIAKKYLGSDAIAIIRIDMRRKSKRGDGYGYMKRDGQLDYFYLPID